MLIGAHVSIADGFDKSIDRAVKIGANCLQTFASSPRSLKTQPFSDNVISSYLDKKKGANMGPHFFHGPYLINLAHEDSSYVQACVDTLVFYQQFAKDIEGEGTIFHIGSHKGKGFETVFDGILAAIIKVLEKTPDGVRLFLENAAGHRGVIGDDFSQLGRILTSIPHGLMNRIGVCLDSQHAFASGYDFRTNKDVEKMISEFEEKIGLEHLHLIHANDSKVNLGGQRDRHENIGEGFIGKEGFRNLLINSKLRYLPFILEVPGKNRSGPRKEDVELLKNIAS